MKIFGFLCCFMIFKTIHAQAQEEFLDLRNPPEGYMVWESNAEVNRVWTGKQYLFVNNDGKTIMELPQFPYVDDFREGVAIIKTRYGKCGYLNLQGELVIDPNWQECRGSSGGFVTVKDQNDDLYLLKNNGKRIMLPLKEATNIQGTAIVVDRNDIELYIDLSKINFDYYHPLMKAILMVSDRHVASEINLDTNEVVFLEIGSNQELYILKF